MLDKGSMNGRVREIAYSMEQQPFTSAPNPFVADAATQFAENPENRCACVLLLDVSGSMAGKPIAELQEGLTVYRDSLAADSLVPT